MFELLMIIIVVIQCFQPTPVFNESLRTAPRSDQNLSMAGFCSLTQEDSLEGQQKNRREKACQQEYWVDHPSSQVKGRLVP